MLRPAGARDSVGVGGARGGRQGVNKSPGSTAAAAVAVRREGRPPRGRTAAGNV